MDIGSAESHLMIQKFVVVSMGTEHNFEHNTYITVA